MQSHTVTPRVDTTIVTVKVIDENDNPPIIIFPSDPDNPISAPATPAGFEPRTFASVAATDADDGVNAQLRYELVKDPPEGAQVAPGEAPLNGTSLFVIDRYSGALSQSKRADLEPLINETFVVLIRVTDQGRPPLSTVAPLAILVLPALPLPLPSDPTHDDVTRHSASAELVTWLSDNTLVLVAAALATFVTVRYSIIIFYCCIV